MADRKMKMATPAREGRPFRRCSAHFSVRNFSAILDSPAKRFSFAEQTAALVALAVLCLAFAATNAWADEPKPDTVVVSDMTIESLLAPIREKHQVPGLIAGVVGPQGLTTVGAVGVRKLGSPEPMLVTDSIHIGSDTKAMTATLLAMLVEQGKLSWTTTLGEVFADLKPPLDADFAGVTLEQLLTHRSGLPANVNYRKFTGGTLVEQREAMTQEVLSQRPGHPPGSKFLYSNAGYIVAGHIAERVTGQSWENLMTVRLFEPLRMSSAGFGVPGTKDQVDQPWGHLSLLGVNVPRQDDNPPLLGPAGTVHCSFADWAKFVSLHLRAGGDEHGIGPRFQGSGFRVLHLLKPESFRKLHTPPPGERYALGWGVAERPFITGPLLIHSGSNTMWLATAAISQKHHIAFLVAANSADAAAHQACDAALAAVAAHELAQR